jgi:catechol 2,3-dioxygenase-like lactoylglutathione lyase family enzyme
MSIRLHHVALSAPEADDAVAFYGGDWGLRETGRSEAGVRLAAAEDSGDDYSLVIISSPTKAVDHFCLAAEDEAVFEELEDRVRSGGVRVLPDAVPCHGLEKALHIADIDGRRVEIGFRPRGDGAPAAVADSVPLKPGHIVLNTPDIEAATDWYQEKLGFGLRDWRAKQMSFLYHNEDHHTVAFSRGPHASLNHVAWEVADINQFFRAVGRVSAGTQVDKLYGPGRHGPGDYVFCYFLDPMGFVCEYETDGIKITDPGDYPFRVWEYSPESADQWLGTLSGGLPQAFREATRGVPDAGLLSPAEA